MTFYTSDGCQYMGMNQATIIRLRTELGKTTQFVDESTYLAYVASKQVK